MRRFLDKWYGDECPFWTWPGTVSALAAIFLLALWIINLMNQAECERKGGNTVKDRVCYLVTMKKID